MSPSTPAHTVTFPVVHPHAAGLDIGQNEIFACVPAEAEWGLVRSFGTFTPDLHALADWLAAHHVDTVAMESTGVYWIPIYEILEARGLNPQVVNARHLKNVPGRKTDEKDCQWIQRLHTFGLLGASFRPEADLRALRTYLRQRATLIEHRAAHIEHMHKALLQMNLQLTQVLQDITGVTGMKILRAIVAGERDPLKLAQARDKRCQSTQDEIARALTGNYRPEHLFALKQALALYDAYTEQLRECDTEIERHFRAIKPVTDDELPPSAKTDKKGSHSKNKPQYDARTLLFRITGVDLVAITGLNESTVQTILSEVGTDLQAFPTDKHFCSWLSLAPHHEISGGRVLRNRILKTGNRAGQAFRLAAQSVSRSPRTAFGAFYRRMKAKLGPEKAIVATAHKIARCFYHVLKERTPYQELGGEEYARRQKARELAALRKKAAQLGVQLVELPA
jgi:transposase